MRESRFHSRFQISPASRDLHTLCGCACKGYARKRLTFPETSLRRSIQKVKVFSHYKAFGHLMSRTSLQMCQNPFSTLPLEIRLAILSCIADLPTLHRLTYTSSAMKDAFESAPANIARQFLCKCPTRFRQVVVATARVHQSEVFHRTKGEKLVHDRHTNPNSMELQAGVDDGQDVGNISQITSKETIQWLLLIACRIEQLSESFLNLLLDRLDRLELEHISDSSFRFHWEFYHASVKPYPQGRPYIPQRRETVSWVEYYRVNLCLWSALLRSLHTKSCVNSEDGCTGHSFESYNHLVESEHWRRDQIELVERFLNTEGVTLGSLDGEALQSHLVESGFYTCPPPSIPIISEHPTDSDASTWGQGIQSAEMPSVADHWFSIQAQFNGWYNNLMRGLPWEPFRQLGFGFWDRQRMCGLGLCSNVYEKVEGEPAYGEARLGKMGVGQVSFAWRSLKLDGKRLTPDPRDDGSAA